jgi:hypothetical protein
MDGKAKRRLYVAWALVVVAFVFDFGSSEGICVNGFVQECNGFDLVNIVCGLLIVVLTFRYWETLSENYESTVPSKFGVALLDIVGIAVLISGFDGKCLCPSLY